MSLKGQYKCADNGKISDLVIIMGPMEMIYVTIRSLRPNLRTLSDRFFSDVYLTWVDIICIRRNVPFLHTVSILNFTFTVPMLAARWGK